MYKFIVKICIYLIIAKIYLIYTFKDYRNPNENTSEKVLIYAENSYEIDTS